MQVRWTPRAQLDLNSQIDYIAESNLPAAVRLRKLVYRHTQMLGKTPEMGRSGRMSLARELVISGTPYIAVYRIGKEFVEILRLLHGAQEYPR